MVSFADAIRAWAMAELGQHDEGLDLLRQARQAFAGRRHGHVHAVDVLGVHRPVRAGGSRRRGARA